MKTTLFSCWIRFCKTKNVLMPILVVGNFFLLMPFEWKHLTGTALGSVLYIALEEYFHRRMHKQGTEFYRTHTEHHRNPTPESGVPELSIFILYFILSIGFWALNRPITQGAWFGVITWLFIYEWIHFLTHTQYKFKSKFGRLIKRNHMRHHFIDEKDHLPMLFPETDRTYEQSL